MSLAAPPWFLLGSTTVDEAEGEVWIAAGFADSLDEGVPDGVIPLPTAAMKDSKILILSVDGIIRGFIRQSDKPLSWLDFGWLCSTWPDARMVWIIPLAELDETDAQMLTLMTEFKDADAPVEAANQDGQGGTP